MHARARVCVPTYPAASRFLLNNTHTHTHTHTHNTHTVTRTRARTHACPSEPTHPAASRFLLKQPQSPFLHGVHTPQDLRQLPAEKSPPACAQGRVEGPRRAVSCLPWSTLGQHAESEGPRRAVSCLHRSTRTRQGGGAQSRRGPGELSARHHIGPHAPGMLSAELLACHHRGGPRRAVSCLHASDGVSY